MGHTYTATDSSELAGWPARPGVYVLLLAALEPVEVTAGKLGTFRLAAGHFAYCGSAAGPGGLAARVGRHLRRTAKRTHWHIDYLTAAIPVLGAFGTETLERLECTWVHRLMVLPGVSVPAPGFGSSDCRARCPAHLVYLPTGVGLEQIEEIVSR